MKIVILKTENNRTVMEFPITPLWDSANQLIALHGKTLMTQQVGREYKTSEVGVDVYFSESEIPAAASLISEEIRELLKQWGGK